jgi:hypothetical protein
MPITPQKRRVIADYNGEHEQRMPSGQFGRNPPTELGSNPPMKFDRNDVSRSYYQDEHGSNKYDNLNENFQTQSKQELSVEPHNINKLFSGNLNDNQLWHNDITEEEQKLVDKLGRSKKRELDLDKYQRLRNTTRQIFDPNNRGN